MDVTLESLSRVIAAIHAASSAPDRWPAALAEIMRLVEASKGALFDLDAAENVLGLTTTGHDPDAQRLYMAHYIAIDPTVRGALSAETGKPWVVYEAFPNSIIARHEYFDFARRIDIGDVITINAEVVSGRRAVLSLQRPYSADRYDAQTKSVIALLAPHLEIAKCTQAKLQGALAKESALSAGLDRFAAAAFIVGADGKVFHLNLSANTMLAEEKTLSVRHGKLLSKVPDLNAALAGAFRLATCEDPRSTLIPVISSSSRKTEMLISPLYEDHEMSSPWERPLALMVVVEPRLDAGAIARRVHRLYGLSVVEARVMAEIALGSSIEDIKIKHGVRESTVRTQLRSIFAKTGTSRQSDLVRLSLEGAPLSGDLGN